MKIRMIYSEQGESIEDMSRDRVHLDLSYNEWFKIKSFIDRTSWMDGSDEITIKRLQTKARNLSNMIKHAKEQPSIWINKRK